jgi:hypothetical protein
MAKVPPTPRGVSTAYFGRYIMKWGIGADGAIARIKTVTEQDLRQENLTCEILAGWYEFYHDESDSNPRNLAAAARAELIAHCLKLLNC